MGQGGGGGKDPAGMNCATGNVCAMVPRRPVVHDPRFVARRVGVFKAAGGLPSFTRPGRPG